MRSLHLIVNPTAGRGAAGKRLPEIEELLRRDGVEYRIEMTTTPGEAFDLAAKAAENSEIVVSAGGDGTLNEVANGLVKSDAALGILPIGSGNDFVKAAGIPSDIEGAVDVLLNGEVQNVDIGNINGKRFVNSLSMGIDGAVAETMNRTKWLPPSLSYHYSVVANIFFYRKKLIRWQSDEESGTKLASLASIMNGTTYGGGYKVAPLASITDGLLDMVMVCDRGLITRIRHLPKLKRGTHLGLDIVTHRRVRRVTVSCDEPMPLAVDGERIEKKEGFELEIEVLPGALPLLVPINAEN